MRSVSLAAFLLATSSISALAASTAAPVLPGFLTSTPQPNCAHGPCYAPYSSSNPMPVAIISGGGSGGTASNFGDAFPAQGTAAGAEYLSSPPTFTSGDMVPLQTDINGNLKITGSISATNPSVGATGAAIPASATYIGGLNSGNLVGIIADAGSRLNVTGAGGTFPATQSGTWTVQPGNTPNTTAWLVTGTGGTFPATQSGAWTVNPTTAANWGVGAPGSAVPANGELMMGTNAGTAFALPGDSTNGLWVNIKSGAGSGGTALADNAAWTAGTTNFTPSGCEYTSGGATAITTAHAGTVACTTGRAFFTDWSSVSGTALSSATEAYGTNFASQTATVPRVDAYITNSLTSLTPGDGITTGTYGSASPTLGAQLLWNGTTYDRQKSAGVTGAGMVAGAAAPGTAIASAGNPLAFAALGSTSDQTAVSNGQTVVPEATPNGKLVTQPWALTPNFQSATTTGQTGTGTVNVLAASGSASLKEYMTSLQMGRSDAGTTAITAAITDGTSTYTFVVPNNGGGGGNNIQFVTPIAFVANHAVTCAASSGVTTFYCTAQGFNAP